ncbi:hypothetical protein BpHYR1_019526 [Brachionus plicatilis]|uniref:Uncharacterized protein n=1 Tax=Brachionus plicatilis TaxID=10195 RepID=A0A3M7PVB1_BRAPC|nr:hypothetical protein BpHYR1_019526 [Brachionus plicatilis]
MTYQIPYFKVMSINSDNHAINRIRYGKTEMIIRFSNHRLKIYSQMKSFELFPSMVSLFFLKLLILSDKIEQLFFETCIYSLIEKIPNTINESKKLFKDYSWINFFFVDQNKIVRMPDNNIVKIAQKFLGRSIYNKNQNQMNISSSIADEVEPSDFGT